ncbi:MAG: peptide ABC transporter substrate-binding protein [Candidatus Binatia bacterium]
MIRPLRPHRHIFAFLLIGFVFVLSFHGCKSAPKDIKGGSDNHFRVNLGTEPPSLDWSLATDHVSFNVISNLMIGLTEFNKELKPSPVIAKSWQLYAGGRRIVFELRDDVFWSDGVKVRARDFEYSWKRLLDPKTASEYAYILFDIVNAQEYHEGKITDSAAVGVRAIDDFKLEVQLKHPASYFLSITTFEVTFPQRQDVIEKFRANWTDPENIVTNGPFLLASWKHENQIELRANPNFFAGKPAIDKVSMFMVNEKTTALAMYEQGRLDFLDNHSIPTLEKRRLAKQRGFKRVPQLRGDYYGFTIDRKPFNDPKVRKAFAMAIDRNVFPKILHGGEQPAPSWIPPGMPAHNSELGLPFNPVEARRLLREAGYPAGKGFPRVTLAYNTQEDHKLVAEAVQGMWQRTLGVVVDLENQEWKVYLKRLQIDPPHVFRLGWGADYPDPDNFMKLFTSDSGNNHTRWKNPRYDQLLEQAARELDPERRAKLYDEAQRILCETDLPIVPLFWTAESTLLNERFEGLEITSMARLDLRHVHPATTAASK